VTDAKEISKYKLESIGEVQEVRWDRGDTELADQYTFFYGKGNENRELYTICFVHNRIISSVKRAELVSDRLWHIILRGRRCDIILLNLHAPTVHKIYNMKDTFYEELDCVFDKFCTYHLTEFG
jgi:hypothetical protein